MGVGLITINYDDFAINLWSFQNRSFPTRFQISLSIEYCHLGIYGGDLSKREGGSSVFWITEHIKQLQNFSNSRTILVGTCFDVMITLQDVGLALCCKYGYPTIHGKALT